MYRINLRPDIIQKLKINMFNVEIALHIYVPIHKEMEKSNKTIL